MDVTAQTGKPKMKRRRTKAVKKTVAFDDDEDDAKIASAPRPMFNNNAFSIGKPKPQVEE